MATSTATGKRTTTAKRSPRKRSTSGAASARSTRCAAPTYTGASGIERSRMPTKQ